MPPVSFPSTIGLEFDWLYPNPPVIQYQLFQIEKYLENTEVLAEEAKQALQYDMAARFQTETDPEGNPWLSLAEPSPYQQGILQLTGELRDTAISDAAWIASPAGVFFDMSVLPEYWPYHEQPDYPAPHRIPRRAFIGPSAEEQARLERVGDEWLAGGLFTAAPGGPAIGPAAGIFRRQARAPSGIFIRLG